MVGGPRHEGPWGRPARLPTAFCHAVSGCGAWPHPAPPRHAQATLLLLLAAAAAGSAAGAGACPAGSASGERGCPSCNGCFENEADALTLRLTQESYDSVNDITDIAFTVSCLLVMAALESSECCPAGHAASAQQCGHCKMAQALDN